MYAQDGPSSRLSLVLIAVSITLMFRRESPGLGSRTQEHFRDFDPVSAIRAREQGFCPQSKNRKRTGIVLKRRGLKAMKKGEDDVPSSLRPRNIGARSLIRGGKASSRPGIPRSTVNTLWRYESVAGGWT